MAKFAQSSGSALKMGDFGNSSMNKKPRIFLSYSWADRKVAEDIDRHLRRLGIDVIRDVRESSYTSSIRQFMRTIRHSDFCLMLLSDSFLRSPNCMFEVLEFVKDEDFIDRMLTLVVDDSDIFSIGTTINYISYWEQEYSKVKSRTGKVDIQNTPEIARHLVVLQNIASTIGEFIRVVADRVTFRIGDSSVDIYPAILRRIGLNPNLSLLHLLDRTEEDLYSCRINDEIPSHNQKRIRLLGRLNPPDQLQEVLKRRFLFQVDWEASALLEATIEHGKEWRAAAKSLRLMISRVRSGAADLSFLAEYVRQGNELETYLSAHLYIRELKRRHERPQTDLIAGLLLPSREPHKLLAAAALLAEFDLLEFTQTLADVLKNLIPKIQGRLAIEAWVQLSQVLRKFSVERYTTLFMLAHYQFLRYRDAQVRPYQYPLLPLHNDIFPTSSHYEALLSGGRKEKMAAVWTMSLRGADITHRARQNLSPVLLDDKARMSLRELLRSNLDFREKWRVCNTIVKANLCEFSGWIREQAVSEDLVNNTVTLNDPVFGIVDEPHCAAFLRAAGYLGRRLREAGDITTAQAMSSFLKSQHDKVLFSERALVVALAVGLGYLGDWRLILSSLEESEPWMHEAAVNVARHWIEDDSDQIRAALDWTKERLANASMSETVLETLRTVHDTLVVRSS